MSKYILLVLMLLAFSEGYAQFTGGIEDGYNYAVLTQSSCPPLVSNFAFRGGNGSGYHDAALTQSNCSPLVSDFIFQGGGGDGYQGATLTQSNCTPLVSDFIFQGGNGDGYHGATLTQSNCPPLVSDFIFQGGNGDGYHGVILTQSVCPPLVSDFIYQGGTADGYGVGRLTQSGCPPPVSDFAFYGGLADGFGLGILQQSICPNNTPLPIELLEFKATVMNDAVEVSWTTVSETNNAFFTVERSNNGANFTALTTVKGAGNSTQVIKYSVADRFPSDGPNYYRLKQTDLDGKFSYTEIVVVYFTQMSKSPVVIYPNPNDGRRFYVKLAGSDKRFITLEILDETGRKILSESFYTDSSLFEFAPAVALTPGMYFISIMDDQKTDKQKLVVK